MRKSIILLFVFSCISCSLEMKPDTAWGEMDYYQTQGQLISLVNGGYVCLQKVMGPGAIIYGEMRSDIHYCNRTTSVDYDNIIRNNITAYNRYASWYSFYQVIQQANLVIAHAREMAEKGILLPEEIVEPLGEAYAMRAFTYFWIVRIWGDAPLVLVPSEGEHYDARMKKTSVDAVFAQIKEDIVQAKSRLSDNGSRTHFTLSSMYALEAQVCAWLQDWKGVQAANSHFFDETGVGIKPDCGYSLAVLYSPTQSSSDNNYIANSEYAALFNVGKSKESIFELSFGIDDNATSYSLYSVFDSVRPTGATKTRYTQDKSKDWRCAINFYGNSPKLTKYFINFENYNTETRNVVLLRLGEMILLQAEAYANLIQEAATISEAEERKNKAIALLNLIRQRAGGEAYQIDASQYSRDDVDPIKILVANERWKELFGEGYRYFDLIRTGTLIEVMQPINGQDDMLSAVWPIHYTDILYSNGSIEQNTYYK